MCHAAPLACVGMVVVRCNSQAARRRIITDLADDPSVLSTSTTKGKHQCSKQAGQLRGVVENVDKGLPGLAAAEDLTVGLFAAADAARAQAVQVAPDEEARAASDKTPIVVHDFVVIPGLSSSLTNELEEALARAIESTLPEDRGRVEDGTLAMVLVILIFFLGLGVAVVTMANCMLQC